jgi:transposase
MPRSPGHAFYDKLQKLLIEAGFDAFVEEVCKPYYAPRMGAPSLPPGRYFRMHMVGYFEGLDSERGIVWRCSDSYSLRDFLRLANRDKVPDHSWLSKMRSRLPHEAHEKVFGWVLNLVAERGLVKGERIGVDGSTMEASAALRTIVRRDSGETYRAMLTRMAQESGVETPTIDDLVRLDRKRKGKKLSNADWTSPTDPDARIARMKDGTTHLAYKPEHAVDLDTGVIVAAPIHPADEGDTTTLDPTLDAAARNLADIGLAPSPEAPCELIADKGYHSREKLKDLDGGVWKTRIAEPKPANGYLRWHGDEAARDAVYGNRARLKSGIGREAMRRRGEMVERSFAHVLDRGGMRRAWLRGRENVHKRYLIHVAGFNLGILMRALFGYGTPREAADLKNAILLVIQTDVAMAIVIVAKIEGRLAMLAIVAMPEHD